jgi:hypothetical protein
MPFVEVFTREELSDAVRAKLAETLLVTMMNIEIGHPTDHARAIGWVWFHTLPGTSWAVGGRFDDTYIKGRKMGLARIIAPEGILNSELKAKALAEVTKSLRDAMGAEDDDDGLGVFAIYEEVPAGTGLTGGIFCLSANCSRRWEAMCQRRGNARSKHCSAVKLH